MSALREAISDALGEAIPWVATLDAADEVWDRLVAEGALRVEWGVEADALAPSMSGPRRVTQPAPSCEGAELIAQMGSWPTRNPTVVRRYVTEWEAS